MLSGHPIKVQDFPFFGVGIFQEEAGYPSPLPAMIGSPFRVANHSTLFVPAPPDL